MFGHVNRFVNIQQDFIYYSRCHQREVKTFCRKNIFKRRLQILFIPSNFLYLNTDVLQINFTLNYDVFVHVYGLQLLMSLIVTLSCDINSEMH